MGRVFSSIASDTFHSFFLLSSLLLFSSLVSLANAKTHNHEFVVQATKVKRLCKTHNSITVNGQFPGPTLEVNNGDTLVIHVTNKARYNVTIHWNTGNKPTSIPMVGHNIEYLGITEEDSPRANGDNNIKKIWILPLFSSYSTKHPVDPLVSRTFLALIGFLVFAVIWSVPEALITAEMGTMFPEDGGYVIWVSSALGPYWGCQQGWMKWLSGDMDNALYPVLFLDYLNSGFPILAHGYPRILAIVALTVALTYMNFRGTTIVGWVAVFLGVFSVLPFVIMGFISVPKIVPSRWRVMDLRAVDWNLYLNTLFWNLNYWDSISTLAGQVDQF
nr:probable polyamine transporter At1g31830 isoform X1 [Tanacetum cinerariifolium]